MRAIRSFCFAALASTVLAAGASAQDRVEFKEPNSDKVSTVSGTIRQENVGGIKIQITGGTNRDIPASRIVDVEYADLPGVLKIEYGQIQTAENMNDLAKALEGYKDVLKKLQPGTKARRHVEYKIAMLQSELATDRTEAGIARDALKTFVSDHADSWQFSPAAQELAKLQIAAEDYAGAIKTLEALNKTPGLPPATKQETELMIIDTMIRAGQLAEAAARINSAITGLAPSDPLRKRLEIFQILSAKSSPAEQVKKLEGIIASTEDPGLRALAYNTMGDVYVRANQERDAMWSYLWVDVVYFQDPQEHLKAVDRLAKLFEKMNDAERAQAYREKLQKIR